MSGAHASVPDAERRAPAGPARPSRPDASMVLLDEVMRRPLDPGYAEAAARRRAGTERPRTRAGWARVLVLALLLGFGTAGAAIELRRPQPDVVAARALLEQEITQRREHVADLTEQVDDVSIELEALQAAALSDTYPALLAGTERDAVNAGELAVMGPGLVVTLRDAASILEDPDDAVSRVQDYDIQVVVNSLWASGAEAISVNGQRLTATSAIRSAGDAILVDLVGLSGPYEIAAIGDPESLPTYFSRSLGQQHLTILASRYGIGSSVDSRDELELRAGRATTLYFTTPAQDLGSSQPGGAPSDTPVSPAAVAPETDVGLSPGPASKENPR